jgi:hypothetical protein
LSLARVARNGQRRLAAFSGPAFSAPALSSIALTASPQNQPARSRCPLKVTPTGEGLAAPLFREGRRTKDAQQSRKKKTMKTNRKKQIGLKSKSAQLSSTNTNTAAAGAVAPKPDNRLPIDTEARKKNRTLPTTKVLELLKTSNPGLFNLAEVVGKWVWVQFRETPAPELRQILAQLGFHWNRERQALTQMFDHDRSASRGTMAPQKLIVFKHQSALGNAPAHKLFERVTIQRKSGVPVARAFSDYDVAINKTGLPAGVELIELL